MRDKIDQLESGAPQIIAPGGLFAADGGDDNISGSSQEV